MKELNKKVFSFCLCIVMLISTFVMSFTVSAKTVESGKCGENLSWTLDDNDTLTIVGTGNMNDAYCLYSRKDSIKSVVIEKGVTSIGNEAFYGCKNLKSITIPDSVTSIGNYAFSNCLSLEDITIPSSVKSIGWDAFYLCANLKSITIPKSVTEIGEQAFRDCSKLTSVEFEDDSKLTVISEYMFYGCENLSSITIPKKVRINEGAFCGCIKLTEISYPGNEIDKIDNVKIVEVRNKELSNPIWRYSEPLKITIDADKNVVYKSKATIKATSEKIPKKYKLAINVNGKQVAIGTNTEVTYTVEQATSDVYYSIKVIDANEKEVNKDLVRDGKITVKSSFFAKIIAFFKSLFGSLSKVEVKP